MGTLMQPLKDKPGKRNDAGGCTYFPKRNVLQVRVIGSKFGRSATIKRKKRDTFTLYANC